MKLREEQLWMVAAITGAEVDSADVDRWITPSAKMTPAERLGVYRHGYVARLVECLEDDYKVVAQTLGEDAFQELCEAYVARHPSSSPNLNWFGRHMPGFLRDRGEAFLSELATLEWALVEVLHAQMPPKMDLTALASKPMEAWETARFVPSEALRVFRFEHPVNAYFQSVYVDEKETEIPPPSPTAVAVYRHANRLWRMNLTPPMRAVLEPLLKGATFGEALAQLEVEESDPSALAEAGQNVMVWFREWVDAGFFARVELA
jgi:hypothetical protein